jgi:hypothetical protein
VRLADHAANRPVAQFFWNVFPQSGKMPLGPDSDIFSIFRSAA